jgi:hypothetical protein
MRTEFDDDIAALERRLADLDQQMARLGGLNGGALFDGGAMAAHAVVARKLAELRAKRERVLAGDEPIEPAPVPKRADAAGNLKMPRRVTKRASPEGRKEADTGQPGSADDQRRLREWFKTFMEADAVERVEDDIQEVIDIYCETNANTPRLFTQGLYAGIVMKLALLSATVSAHSFYQRDRRREFEARLTALEERPTMQYRGVFETSRQYMPGDFVTHDGSLWHCNRPTHGPVPGFDKDGWTLAVKRGRDGKGRKEGTVLS